MALRTRKPTGAVPWPLILLEGEEKSGRSYACAVLSASPKVGRTAWLDLNEGAADEYGTIPGARYEVIEHDGSWHSIAAAVADAKAEAQKDRDNGEKPYVLVIDSMTAEWDLLKAWADSRARKTDAGRLKLAKDPNAEITISMNLWNDANSRHRKVMTMLMTFPGIVVVTARGKDVAALDAKGRPIEGTKEYKVDGNKSLAFDASCWVRMYRERPAIVVGARSVHAGVRPGKDKPHQLDPDWTLESLVFGHLKCDPDAAPVRDLVAMRPERAPEEIRDEALKTGTDFARIRELWAEADQDGYQERTVANEQGADEPVLQFLLRIGNEKRRAEQGIQPPAGRTLSGPEWADDFMNRLAATRMLPAVARLKNEAAAAEASGQVTPGVAAELLEAAIARQREITAVAEAGQPAGEPTQAEQEAVTA